MKPVHIEEKLLKELSALGLAIERSVDDMAHDAIDEFIQKYADAELFRREDV